MLTSEMEDLIAYICQITYFQMFFFFVFLPNIKIVKNQILRIIHKSRVCRHTLNVVLTKLCF